MGRAGSKAGPGNAERTAGGGCQLVDGGTHAAGAMMALCMYGAYIPHQETPHRPARLAAAA